MAYGLAEEIGHRLLVPFGCRDFEIGIPAEFPVQRAGVAFVAEQKLRERVPFDMYIEGVHALVLDENGDPTLDFAINFRFTRSEDWCIYTANDGQAADSGRGFPIPAAAVVGSATEPHYWSAPKIARKTETLEVKIRPDPGRTLTFVNLTFTGKRLRGSEADALECIDPTRSGYLAMAFPDVTVNLSGVLGEPGAERSRQLPLDSLRYDFLMSEGTVINHAAADPDHPSRPLVGVISLVRERDPTFRHELAFGGVPSNRYGGHNNTDGAPLAWRPVSSPLPACVIFRQQATVETFAAALRAPGNNPSEWQVLRVLHGQRIPTEGLPPFLGYPGIPTPPGSYDPRGAPA